LGNTFSSSLQQGFGLHYCHFSYAEQQALSGNKDFAYAFTAAAVVPDVAQGTIKPQEKPPKSSI
jgi:hypothetical protein